MTGDLFAEGDCLKVSFVDWEWLIWRKEFSNALNDDERRALIAGKDDS